MVRIAMLSPVFHDMLGRYQTRWRQLASGDWIFEIRRAAHGGQWEAWESIGQPIDGQTFAGYFEAEDIASFVVDE